jgi:hypothetical protein
MLFAVVVPVAALARCLSQVRPSCSKRLLLLLLILLLLLVLLVLLLQLALSLSLTLLPRSLRCTESTATKNSKSQDGGDVLLGTRGPLTITYEA